MFSIMASVLCSPLGVVAAFSGWDSAPETFASSLEVEAEAFGGVVVNCESLLGKICTR